MFAQHTVIKKCLLLSDAAAAGLPMRRDRQGYGGIGIPSLRSGQALPMIHGLEEDPQREILRWGPQAHATSAPGIAEKPDAVWGGLW